MAIISFDRVWFGETSQRTMQGGRRYQELFRAISNAGDTDNESNVRAHPNCPFVGQSVFYDGDQYWANEIEVTRARESRIEFLARVNWTNQLNQLDLEWDTAPTERIARYEWSTGSYMVAMYRDMQGKTILNSAGDPPDPPPEVPHGFSICTVTRHVPQTPPWITKIKYRINESPFVVDGMQVAKGCGRIEDVRVSDWKQWGNVLYRTLTLEIAVREPEEVVGTLYDGGTDTQATSRQGWDLLQFNQGLNEISGFRNNEPVKQRILLDSELAVDPQALDLQGKRIKDPEPGDYIHYRWQQHRYFDFNQLPLS